MTTTTAPKPPPPILWLVSLHSRYGPDDGPIDTVATSSTSEVAKLTQRAKQKNLEVRVSRASTFGQAWKFLGGL